MSAQQVLPLLKGKPIAVFRKGCFPNREEVRDVQLRNPGCTIRVENMYVLGKHPRFAITVGG